MAAGNKVFISYSNRDVEVANTICARIESGGRPCWIAPRDIEPSSDWAEQIIDGINGADVMVLVFSGFSNQSPQVRREVERAINRDMPVIPFRIEKVLPAKSLEYFLSTQHWFDAFDGPLEPHVARLCSLVRTVTQRRAGEPGDAGPAVHLVDPSASTETRPRVEKTSGYRDDDLAFVARELAHQIGPIARILVQRAGAAHPSPAMLVETLADEFRDPRERAAFVASCRRRLGL